MKYKSDKIILVFIVVVSIIISIFYAQGNYKKITKGLNDLFILGSYALNLNSNQTNKNICYSNIIKIDDIFYARTPRNQLGKISFDYKNENQMRTPSLSLLHQIYIESEDIWYSIYTMNENQLEDSLLGTIFKITYASEAKIKDAKVAIYQNHKAVSSNSRGWVYYDNSFYNHSNNDLIFRNGSFHHIVDYSKKQPRIAEVRSAFSGVGAWPQVGDRIEAITFNINQTSYKEVAPYTIFRQCNLVAKQHSIAFVIKSKKKYPHKKVMIQLIEPNKLVELDNLKFDYVFSKNIKNKSELHHRLSKFNNFYRSYIL